MSTCVVWLPVKEIGLQ